MGRRYRPWRCWDSSRYGSAPGTGADLLPAPITPAQAEEALRRNPDAAAVYVTSPDYFGKLTDIAGLAEVCHRHGVPLLVDNSHGAELRFTP